MHFKRQHTFGVHGVACVDGKVHQRGFNWLMSAMAKQTLPPEGSKSTLYL
jgi:hypothetical protein